MLVSEQDKLRQDIAELANKYGRGRSAMIPMLQDIQKAHYGISEFSMQAVADELNIHPVEVFSIISFYSFLDSKPKGRFIIRLCQTISCDMAGKERVANQLVNDLGVDFGETTHDGKFTLEWANCIGMCDKGPALLVNDFVFTCVTPEKVHEILETCRKTFGVFAPEGKEDRLV